MLLPICAGERERRDHQTRGERLDSDARSAHRHAGAEARPQRQTTPEFHYRISHQYLHLISICIL